MPRSVLIGRVVQPGEPEWLEEDLDALMEWDEYRESLCIGCSHPRHESFDPDGPRYEAKALRCRACQARDDEVKRWSADKTPDTGGMYFVAVERS